jgi:hypothetical protein
MNQIKIFCLLFLIVFIGFSQEDKVIKDTSIVKVDIHGWGSYEFGQIVSGHISNDTRVEKIWRQRVYANIKADLSVGERLHMIVAPEILMFSRFPVNMTQNFRQDVKAQYDVYLDETYFKYVLGDINKPFLGFKIGYFKFKYNKDVRDLGEYVFRGGTYPPYIHNVFDHAYQRLLGLNIFSNLFDSLWHQEIIVNSHTEYCPRDDYSISYFTDVNLKSFTLGAGVNFDRILSADENKTTPKSPTNMYFHGAHVYDSLDPFGNTIRVAYYDDTLYYSFRGIKLMGRFAFDPKVFLPNVNIFGNNDLRLYGEACILGVANIINEDTSKSILKHPYEKIWQRIPWMIGFNLPTFKILDVFSIELQYWNNPFANEFYNVRRIFEPSHYEENGWGIRKNENFKWCIYLKKTFLERFSVILAFARDNLLDIDESDYEPIIDYEETYRYPGDWYWRFKLQADF